MFRERSGEMPLVVELLIIYTNNIWSQVFVRARSGEDAIYPKLMTYTNNICNQTFVRDGAGERCHFAELFVDTQKKKIFNCQTP